MSALDGPIVVGELTLRRWLRADAPALSRAVEASLDHLRPWMPWAVAEPLSAAERVALIETWDAEWDAGENWNLGLWLGADVVGACGLHRRIGPGGLEIGYWVQPAFTRRGFATAAAAALTAAAFERADVARVEIHPDRENRVSCRIPLRLGFELVGVVDAPRVAAAESGTRELWRMEPSRWAGRDPAQRRSGHGANPRFASDG